MSRAEIGERARSVLEFAVGMGDRYCGRRAMLVASGGFPPMAGGGRFRAVIC
jgi:hypothetical protein